ncbi:RNA polymerase sigma factor [Streptomyces sp. P9-A2]|uniref:RNA polymerase sigma factor n=1 Tax=Streptomyces sp. P9-A2 TaxID=3072284 RepID=UPI002FC59230
MDDIQTATDRERAARFTAFYARDHPRVSAFVHRRVGDRGTAEELTAEVFRIAWERTLGGEEVSTGWLFVTARNLLSNHHRATARLTELHRRITDELDRAPASGEDSAVLKTLEPDAVRTLRWHSGVRPSLCRSDPSADRLQPLPE